MAREQKDLIKDLYLNHINQHDLTQLDQFVSDQYSDLSSGGKGLEVYKSNLQNLFNGFPDVVFTLKELIEEGDKLVLRWEWSGTHLGHFAKSAPTSRRVSNVGVVIFRFKESKIIESWTLVDRLAVMHQIS